MRRKRPVPIDPDLIIGTHTVVDRMGDVASKAAETGVPVAWKMIRLVREQARRLCSFYQNCRKEDWCWHCSSGQDKRPLYRGQSCLTCKLLTADAHNKHKYLYAQRGTLVQIKGAGEVSSI